MTGNERPIAFLPRWSGLMQADSAAHLSTLGWRPPRLIRGLIGKDTRPGPLAVSIRRVAQGERVVDPALVSAAVQARPDPFTPRERDVLRVMALGLPSAEIARQLGIAKGTVDQYVSTILRKTGTRNRLEAVHTAQESGWLPANRFR